MKKTLLEIVQNILSDLDSEDVNSISDSVEALQVAKVVEATFYDLIATRTIPEHTSLIKLTSLSDSNFPTHFVIQDEQAKITDVWYDVSDTNSFDYRKLVYLEPLDFLRKTDGRQENYTSVEDKTAGTRLRITNDSQPNYFTSFDDTHIVCDSFKATVDTTLQSSKSRAMGTTHPAFSISDSFTPDIDSNIFPYLIREATSRCFSTFKGAPDQKIEQAARRQKVHVQNDKRKLGAPSKMRNYGRR